MRRTNVEIDDELLTQVMRRYGHHTPEEAVHAALREVAVRPIPHNELASSRGPVVTDSEVERPMSWNNSALPARALATGPRNPVSFSRRMGGLFLKMGAVAVLIFGVPMFHILWTPLSVLAALALMIAGSTLSPSNREQAPAE
jgi:Arc/MetJ family transcription regulator